MNVENQSLMKEGSFWLPGSYSTLSDAVDLQFYAVIWLSVIFTVAIVIVTAFFCVKFYRRKGNEIASKQVVHNNRLEFIWTFIPFLIVMGIFYWGFKDYLRLTVAPTDAVEIQVVGKKWFWAFEYPGTGITSVNDLVVPVNTTIKLVMTSEDVLHSFYIPNFRVKRDVLPNRYSNLWFDATKEGRYQVFCTEYCGDGHSAMGANLIVMSQEKYDEWKKSAGSTDDIPLDELGKKLYTSKGCNACHSIDGSMKIGPSWKGVYGIERELTTGEKVLVDENYIRESIVYPANKIAKGYQNVMPSYAGLLSDREITALIEYIKSLK